MADQTPPPVLDGSVTDPDQLLDLLLDLAGECAGNGPTGWLADQGMRLGELFLTLHARLSRAGILPTAWVPAAGRPVTDVPLPRPGGPRGPDLPDPAEAAGIAFRAYDLLAANRDEMVAALGAAADRYPSDAEVNACQACPLVSGGAWALDIAAAAADHGRLCDVHTAETRRALRYAQLEYDLRTMP